MTLAKDKAKTNETFIVQASLTIVTYDRQNMFIVQATGDARLDPPKKIPTTNTPAYFVLKSATKKKSFSKTDTWSSGTPGEGRSLSTLGLQVQSPPWGTRPRRRCPCPT
jgi:hypothetical protein